MATTGIFAEILRARVSALLPSEVQTLRAGAYMKLPICRPTHLAGGQGLRGCQGEEMRPLALVTAMVNGRGVVRRAQLVEGRDWRRCNKASKALSFSALGPGWKRGTLPSETRQKPTSACAVSVCKFAQTLVAPR